MCKHPLTTAMCVAWNDVKPFTTLAVSFDLLRWITAATRDNQCDLWPPSACRHWGAVDSPGGCSAQGSFAEIASIVFFSWWQCVTFAQITRWGALKFATEKITMGWMSTLRMCLQPLVLTSTSGSTHTGFSSQQQKSLYGVCWICSHSMPW